MCRCILAADLDTLLSASGPPHGPARSARFSAFATAKADSQGGTHGQRQADSCPHADDLLTPENSAVIFAGILFEDGEPDA